MAQEPVVIPEKIYFKIGEVCELVGVQAHVLRYWETEFPMLSPQKNKSGQRSYRRRDVEIALRIKQLLYVEMFTIAGAKKRLQTESRGGSKAKPSATATTNTPVVRSSFEAPTLFDTGFEVDEAPQPPSEVTAQVNAAPPAYNPEQRDALKTVAAHLLELREMLRTTQV
jgi:DNA-binding transcriptional MerR regulator